MEKDYQRERQRETNRERERQTRREREGEKCLDITHARKKRRKGLK